MIRVIIYLIWAAGGIATAYLFLKSQSWSVWMIHPDHPSLSHWLIVGGAVIRWLALLVIITLSLIDSIFSTLIFFAFFIVSRLLILVKWQKIHTLHLLKSKSLKG